MTVNLAIGPLVALVAGILILVVPRLLNFIVAIYLIIIGLIGIFGWNGTHIHATGIERGPEARAAVMVAIAARVPPGLDIRAVGAKGGACDSQA